MIFENVELVNPNISYGPVPGRVYSFDHITDSLVVKTFPGGNLVQTAPLSSPLQNEVISLEYDGYYFYTLTKLGSLGNLGNSIQKWFYDGATVTKLIGLGNEIPLVNGSVRIYDSEALVVRTYTTQLSFSVSAGSTSVTLASSSFLSPNDPIYFGPSSAESGELEAAEVQSVVGNVVNLKSPLSHGFLVGDKVRYRKDLWLFNNASGLNTNNGSLIQINPFNGSILGVRTGAEFKGVTASTVKANGDFLYVRNLQLLTYRPFGPNSGFQSSATILNEKPNRKEIIKVNDITSDSTSVLKLQKELVYFDTGSSSYLETSWVNYNVDQEFFANRVFSITHTRDDRSLLFKENTTATFTIKVRDQYDIAVSGRSLSVSENDSTGVIVPGFTSVTTDTRGEAESRYRTSAGLQHDLPEITITDVITGINSKTEFVQIPNIQGIGFLTQLQKFVSRLQISQLPLVAQSFISQVKSFVSEISVLQSDDVSLTIPVVQRKQGGNSVLSQVENVSSDKPVVQQVKKNDITQVQQYDFLVFAIPEPFSIKNPVDTSITVRIVGFGARSLIPSSLVFIVNGTNITSNVQVTPFAGGLELFYNPPVNFPYFSIVTIEVYILDDDVPQNLISTTYYFETVADFKDPVLIQQFPPNFSTGNSSNTEVFITVRDSETGIDSSSIEFYVNGKKVSPSISTNDGLYTISYQSPTLYTFESTVSASLRVSDNAGNEIVFPWNFNIGESEGIFFVNSRPEQCQVLVPVNSPVCIEAFGEEQGIHIGTAVFEVDGAEVIFGLVPKVYRKD